jgi:hypothetical protein
VVKTGITDLQNDFDVEAEDNWYAKRQKQLAIRRGKQHRADVRHFSEKGYRGKTTLRGDERKKFVRNKARRRRVELGLEGRKRPFNLSAAVRVFQRTGRLPKVSVDVVRESHADNVNPAALKRMINAMLVRSGIEENPGPPSMHDPGSSGSYYDDPAPGGHGTSQAVKWQPKIKRIQEKATALGDTGTVEQSIAADEKRLREKHHNAPGTALAQEIQRDKDAKKGGEIAAAEAADEAKVKAAEAPVERVENVDFQADGFVYRHGNFAKRYAIDSLRRGRELNPLDFIRRAYRSWRRAEPGEIYDPVSDAHNEYRPFDDHSDRAEVVSLNFRGFGVLFALSGLYYWIFLGLGILAWLASFFGWMTYAMTWPLTAAAIGTFFGLIFSVDERYSDGDWMIECGPVRVDHIEADRDGDNRHPQARDTKVTHQAVYASYPVHLVQVRMPGNFFARGLLKVLGSWFMFWNYRAYFSFREVREERRIDVVLASHLLTALQTSSAKGYDAILEVAKVQAARISTIQRPDFVHLHRDIVLDTCKWCAARMCRAPVMDARPDAALPF